MFGQKELPIGIEDFKVLTDEYDVPLENAHFRSFYTTRYCKS